MHFQQNNQSRKHHYLPIFYIKGFLDQENKFFRYDKVNDQISSKRITPSQIFFIWNRNTVKSPLGSTDAIEEFYSKLDSECAEVIHEFRDKPNTEDLQTDQNIALLRFFIINLFWRIPKFDHLAQAYLDQSEITFWDKTTGLQVENLELEMKLRSDPNHLITYRPTFTFEMIKNLSRSRKGIVSSQLYGFKKDIVLIGDHPILFKNSPSQQELLSGDFIIPISSRRVYRLTSEDLGLNFAVENVLQLNALIIEQSVRYICGPDKEFLEQCVEYWKQIKSKGILFFLNEQLFRK